MLSWGLWRFLFYYPLKYLIKRNEKPSAHIKHIPPIQYSREKVGKLIDQRLNVLLIFI